jgi:hypothetical protein
MGSIFSSPSPPTPPAPLPPPPSPPPTTDDPAIADSRRKLKLAEQQRRGRAATILTSGLGDLSPTPVDRRTLTGTLTRTLGGGR